MLSPTTHRSSRANEDDNDGYVCSLYERNELRSLSADIVFWIDCSNVATRHTTIVHLRATQPVSSICVIIVQINILLVAN